MNISQITLLIKYSFVLLLNDGIIILLFIQINSDLHPLWFILIPLLLLLLVAIGQLLLECLHVPHELPLGSRLRLGDFNDLRNTVRAYYYLLVGLKKDYLVIRLDHALGQLGGCTLQILNVIPGVLSLDQKLLIWLLLDDLMLRCILLCLQVFLGEELLNLAILHLLWNELHPRLLVRHSLLFLNLLSLVQADLVRLLFVFEEDLREDLLSLLVLLQEVAGALRGSSRHRLELQLQLLLHLTSWG